MDSTCYKLKNLIGGSQGSRSQNSKNSPFAIVASHYGVDNSDWVLDTSVIHHLTHDSSNLGNATPYPSHDGVFACNGKYLAIFKNGKTHISTLNKDLILDKLLHIPLLTSNLIYVHQLCHENNVLLSFFSYISY